MCSSDLSSDLYHWFNIRGVPGIELSSTSPKGELHILGYRFDLDSPGLVEVLAQYRSARRKRNWEICERLRRLGISISMEDIEAHARGIVGRPHIAQALWERGYALSIRDAFSRVWPGAAWPWQIPSPGG